MEAPQAIALAVCLLAPLAASDALAGEEWRLVLFSGPIHADERAFLASLAEPLLDYDAPFGYVARLSAADAEALSARPAVVDVRPVDAASKAARSLAPGAGAVRVLTFPGEDPDAFAAHLVREGAASARIHAAAEPFLDVEMGALSLEHLMAHGATRYVEPLRERGVLDNERASAIVQGGSVDAWPVHARGVDGSTQLVASCDTGLQTDAPLGLVAGRTVHEMFADDDAILVHNVPSWTHRKVALYYSPIDEEGMRGDIRDIDAHGTHVAGTLAGDAGVWGARDGHDGVAFGARLVVCDLADATGFHVVADPARYFDPAYDAGARVHSNSWGTVGDSNAYSLVARQHDAYAWEHRDLLIVRSVGNTGPDGAIRPEAVAKSVVAVGATANAPEGAVWEASGRGPVEDGRVKPDLVAPGECLTSASIASATAYACWRGTSQATPVVAGAAALVRDYFAKGFHPSGAANGPDARAPSAALVRAVLVASARPLEGASTADEGWGRPDLARALAFAGEGRTLHVHDEDAPLATGDAWTTTIDVPAGASIGVALAWTDHPAAPGASVALVNDLDLELVLPGGAVLEGNAELGAPDRANVVERLALTDAAPGAYVVRVKGWNVPMGPQPFGLVALVEEG